MLLLPKLTYDLASSIIETLAADGSSRPIGGFAYAQEGQALGLLWRYWRADTLRQQLDRLREATTIGTASTLLRAIEWALTVPELQSLADSALDALNDHDLELLSHTVDAAFLEIELEYVSAQLGETALGPLVAWLQREHASGVTLVPCGWLAAIPFTALPLPDAWSDDQGPRTLGDLLPSSVVPSARILLAPSRRAAAAVPPSPAQPATRPRSGVFAIGNPHPTHQDLPWGEAEALATAQIARTLNMPAGARIQEMATRDWFLDKLENGTVVVASCHGAYIPQAPLRSGLRLANRLPLTLADILIGDINLRGLRLVVLSACQSANAHLRGPTDEVRGLTTALLQAGAQAVLAALWPVDDEATFLLMSRFAYEWLPRMNHEPPATALARAQRWLRTLSNQRLRDWRLELSLTTQCAPASAAIRNPDSSSTGAPDPTSGSPVQSIHTTSRAPTLLRAIRGIGDHYQLPRYDVERASEEVRQRAWERGTDADTICPFADARYWSAFQIYGW